MVAVTVSVLPSAKPNVALVFQLPSAGHAGGVVMSALPPATRTGTWKSIDLIAV